LTKRPKQARTALSLPALARQDSSRVRGLLLCAVQVPTLTLSVMARARARRLQMTPARACPHSWPHPAGVGRGQRRRARRRRPLRAVRVERAGTRSLPPGWPRRGPETPLPGHSSAGWLVWVQMAREQVERQPWYPPSSAWLQARILESAYLAPGCLHRLWALLQRGWPGVSCPE